jgi:hypothetical protein
LNTAPATCTADFSSNCRESLIYSTYLGGNDGEDVGRGIAAHSSGIVYVAGSSESTNFPTKNPFQSGNHGDYDLFIAKLNTRASGAASLLYASYLGGSGEDFGRGLGLDPSGNAYVTGHTRSSDFPRKNPFQPTLGDSDVFNSDAFITKISGDQPTLASLTLNPSSVAGSKPVTGTVTLTAPAPSGGVVVTLTDNIAATTVPPSVTIPAGLKSKTFTITTKVVTANQTGTVTAKLGAVTKNAPLTVRRIGVLSLGLNPNPVVGPNNVTGTVTLEGPATTGGITVALSSSNSAVAAPAVNSILIPAGTSSKTFTIRTADVRSSGTATIKATANGISKSKVLTVN